MLNCDFKNYVLKTHFLKPLLFKNAFFLNSLSKRAIFHSHVFLWHLNIIRITLPNGPYNFAIEGI